MSEINDPVELGRFGSVYGVHGWIRVHSYTDDPESVFIYQPWFIDVNGSWREIRLAEWKHHGDGYICKLEGFDQREESQTITGLSIYVDEEALPELADDEFYVHELIGMRVVNTEGYDLGVVEDLMETGANLVLVVKANQNDSYGKKERLLPLVFDSTVINVDQENKRVDVIWDPDF